MDAENLNELKKLHKWLLLQYEMLGQVPGALIPETLLNPIETALKQLNTKFRRVGIPFNRRDYYVRLDFGTAYFSVSAIRLYLSGVISQVKVFIQQPSDTTVSKKN